MHTTFRLAGILPAQSLIVSKVGIGNTVAVNHMRVGSVVLVEYQCLAVVLRQSVVQLIIAGKQTRKIFQAAVHQQHGEPVVTGCSGQWH